MSQIEQKSNETVPTSTSSHNEPVGLTSSFNDVVDLTEVEINLTDQKCEKKELEVIDLTQDDPAIISVVKHTEDFSSSSQGSTTSHSCVLPPPTTMVNSISSTLLRGKGFGFGEIFKRATSPVVTLAAGPLAQKRQQHSGSDSPKRVVQEVCSLPEGPIKRQRSQHDHVHHHNTKLHQDQPHRKTTMQEQYYPSLGNSAREWELTNFGYKYRRNLVKKKSTCSMEFSVMSYNILSQDLLDDNIHLYPGYSEEVLKWENRRDKLIAEIEFYKPDILCLQEVNCDHYAEFLIPKLRELGYHGVYKQRTGGKLDGCAIIYKEAKFSKKEIMGVEYLQKPHPLLDRDNVGVIVKLKPKEGRCDSSLCIANTHLLYNPGRGDIKLGQLILLLAEIDRLSHAAGRSTSAEAHSPVILCGDLNSTPGSSIYKFLTRGYLNYENLLAGRLSGQRPECKKTRVVERDFFPRELGISDQCQYVDHSIQRTFSAQNSEQSGPSAAFYPSPNMTLDEMGHLQESGNWESNARNPFTSQNSGHQWHHLNLESAYSHRIKRLGYKEREVTTQHSQGGCIVDYILYNVLQHSQYNRHVKMPAREGKLKLIGRLGLLSGREISELGNLPNDVNPSDHLPLLARFLLE